MEDGTDPEYLRRVKQLREVYEKRLFVAEVFKQYELAAATEEYEREKAQAIQQFEAKGLELKECLLNDLQDKKKAYDNYRHNLDLASGRIHPFPVFFRGNPPSPIPPPSSSAAAIDSFEPKNMVTRKLRRRHCDPVPTVEKRRKVAPLSSLVYILDESEVDDDIKVIFKVRTSITHQGQVVLLSSSISINCIVHCPT